MKLIRLHQGPGSVGSRRAAVLVAAALALTVGFSGTGVAASISCDMQLTVELTPDVPNPRDEGFVSSLLNNQADYSLTLLRQDSDTVIVLELSGPGPDERCQDVVDEMRKDSRVLSIDVVTDTAAS